MVFRKNEFLVLLKWSNFPLVLLFYFICILVLFNLLIFVKSFMFRMVSLELVNLLSSVVLVFDKYLNLFFWRFVLCLSLF